MGTEHATAYLGVRERVTALLAPLGDLRDRPCPATPEWSVHDVLAHLSGVCADVEAGRLDGITTDAWTAAQVEPRRAITTAELLAEWDRLGSGFATALGGAPDVIAGQAVFDAITHEFDIRHALGQPGGRDSDAFAIAWAWITVALSGRDGAAVAVVTDEGDEFTMGTGDAVASLRTSRFECFRGTTGRRSTDEVAAWAWAPAPRPDLVPGAAIFRLRDTALGE
ncbi:MAG: maleylpyruvate isomerase N-terminal domain-containing protein [Actinomycetota bacterium]